MINLWDFSIWDFLVQMGILMVVLLIANTLRRKISFIRKSLLPTSVIAGILVLIIKELLNLTSFQPISDTTMEAVTYHALGLGFICLALKTTKAKASKKESIGVLDSGMLTVSTYLMQGIIGLAVTILLGYTVFPWLFKASGLLLPMGFGQGSGQALNFGTIFETHGFEGGSAFGLTIAAVGFVWACIGGVVYLNIMKKKGKFTPVADQHKTYVSNEEVSAPNEIPLTESVDKFTIQIAIVLLVYFITFLCMQGVSWVCDKGWLGNFGIKTVKPMIWGFNFMLGTLFALLVKLIMKKLRKHNIMTRDYPNNFLLNRTGAFMFDVMIVAGIAAIKIDMIVSLLLPLAIICSLGGFATMFYVDWVCRKKWPEYRIEQSVAFFGMLLGTASTGMILLREVDPGFKTPAANNLVLQSIPAIIFGFPLMMLMSLAPEGDVQTLITFGILIVFFLVMNILIFRSSIFKRRGGTTASPQGGSGEAPDGESGSAEENFDRFDAQESEAVSSDPVSIGESSSSDHF